MVIYSQFNAKFQPETKAKLEEIRLHYFRRGQLEMSMTRIVEDLIAKEHKRLKL